MAAWGEAQYVIDELQNKLGVAPNNMRSFTAYAIDTSTIGLRFSEPVDSVIDTTTMCAVGGVQIMMSETGYPTQPYEGTLVVDNKEPGKYATDPYRVTGLTINKTYYFTAFPYSTGGIFNTSPSDANRASAHPSDGEAVNITISIPDASGFTEAIITLVDTDGTNQTATVTGKTTSATFGVPIGHNYHLEIGTCDGYTPSITQTETRVAEVGHVNDVSLSYAYFTSNISITYPAGSVCKAVCEQTTYTAPDTSGSWDLAVHKAGTWDISCQYGEQSTKRSVVISATGEQKTVTLAYWEATIIATYPTGSTCTLTDSEGQNQQTATQSPYTFTVNQAGTYTLKITDGEKTATKDVEITTDGQAENISMAYFKIYGIRRKWAATNDSTEYERLDDAVGMTATASKGTVAGKSDFDSCYPWSEIKRETLSSGDIMVKIPKFWYERKREGEWEYIRISDSAGSGFALHPAFQHNGKNQEYIYVAGYKTGSGNVSKRGLAPLVNQTRAEMRNGAKSKGTGWGIIDISTHFAIQALYLVEYADNNSQAKVGRGYCDSNSAAINSGSCDNVPGLTGIPAGTDGKTDVVYRGIEGVWGNIWEWVDGLNHQNGQFYVCNNQASYADDTSSGYTRLGITVSQNGSGYYKEVGFDANNPAYLIPTVYGGSETTCYCDYGYTLNDTTWRLPVRSGGWSFGGGCGVSCLGVNCTSSGRDSAHGSRLLFIPS